MKCKLRLSITTFFDPSRSMEEVNILLSTERYLNITGVNKQVLVIPSQ